MGLLDTRILVRTHARTHLINLINQLINYIISACVRACIVPCVLACARSDMSKTWDYFSTCRQHVLKIPRKALNARAHAQLINLANNYTRTRNDIHS